MKWIQACCFALLLPFAGSGLHAQMFFHQPGEQLRVFLVTFGPGSDPWEKFGHDAIVIQDPEAGTDIIYNWGVFDFGEDLKGKMAFGWHFLQGRLLYSMQSDPTDLMLNAYRNAGRSILAQELHLTAVQKLNLQARLIANDTDANRYYLYDYFKKNCATMARDAIDQTIGGAIHAKLGDVQTATTYRWHDRRTTADALWLYLFLDDTLGHPVDHPLTEWEECFLPGKLAEYIADVQVTDEHGKQAPLVMGSKQINVGGFPERSIPPSSFFYGFLAAGLGIGCVLGVLGTVGQTFRVARWMFQLLVILWSALIGAFGALDTVALLTNHAAAKWNENWFQTNPLSLLLIVLAPAIYWFPTDAKKTAFAVATLSTFGLIAKVTPWFWQSNGSIIAIALPIHLGIAWGIARLAHHRLTALAAKKSAGELIHAT